MHHMIGAENGFYSRGIGLGIMSGMIIFKSLIFISLIVVGFKLLNKYFSGSYIAMKILDERFAKGEIGEDEYLKRKQLLIKK